MPTYQVNVTITVPVLASTPEEALERALLEIGDLTEMPVRPAAEVSEEESLAVSVAHKTKTYSFIANKTSVLINLYDVDDVDALLEQTAEKKFADWPEENKILVFEVGSDRKWVFERKGDPK